MPGNGCAADSGLAWIGNIAAPGQGCVAMELMITGRGLRNLRPVTRSMRFRPQTVCDGVKPLSGGSFRGTGVWNF